MARQKPNTLSSIGKKNGLSQPSLGKKEKVRSTKKFGDDAAVEVNVASV